MVFSTTLDRQVHEDKQVELESSIEEIDTRGVNDHLREKRSVFGFFAFLITFVNAILSANLNITINKNNNNNNNNKNSNTNMNTNMNA